MWHRTMMLAVLLLGLANSVKGGHEGRTCLDEAIPENQRSNITIGGVSMPLGVWSCQWASGYISAHVYAILAGEVLGYQIKEGGGSSSKQMVFALGGCLDPSAYGTDPKCGTGEPVTEHVGFENWNSFNTQMPGWIAKIGEMAPLLMGGMGYEGLEGMYIMDTPLSAALSDSGLHLEYYGSFNSSWYKPEAYFPSISTIDLSLMKKCSTGRMSFSQDADIYVKATGDVAGVENVSGQLKLKCWNEVWWLSPACRNTPQSCIPVVSGGDSWALGEMIQQMSFYNMPLAFGTAIDKPNYKSINIANKGMLYAFEPDTTFIAQKPKIVRFPPNNAGEYIQGIYGTAKAGTILGNWYFKDLKAVADRAHILLGNYKLSQDSINVMLGDVVSVGDEDHWAGACRWVNKNKNLWRNWIPDSTTCSEGKGLVDSAGLLVENRSQAIDCKVQGWEKQC